MRSSNCFFNTSAVGSDVPCFLNCDTTVETRSFKSFSVMTSLFTTATIRSSSITPPGFTGVLSLVSSFGTGGVNNGLLAGGDANGACASASEAVATASTIRKAWKKRCVI